MIRAVGATLLVLVVGISAVVLVWSVTETSTARVSGTTETSSFFSVGTVSLESDVDSSSLLFDASGLYPGRTVTGCVDVVYDGTLPGSIRLHGWPVGATGLEDYLELTLTRSPIGTTCERFDGGGETLFTGLLADLWQEHPDYRSGLVLSANTGRGNRYAIRATGEVRDDNRAQGLNADFMLAIEVRP